MSFAALIASAVIDLSSPEKSLLACTFPSADRTTEAIRVHVEALPSLRDVDGLYRVRIDFGHARHYGGLAQPISRTNARDVLIRAEASGETFYTIGLRDDGRAALNLLHLGEVERRETRKGTCNDPARVLDTWLNS